MLIQSQRRQVDLPSNFTILNLGQLPKYNGNCSIEPLMGASAECLDESMIHAFTVDVEDYHNLLSRDWLGLDGAPTGAVVENTTRILRHMADHGVRGTFFVLGEVAASFSSRMSTRTSFRPLTGR